MNEPEISRRCSSCGASIRKRSQFCPQCGEALSMRTGASDDSNTEALDFRDTLVEMRPIESGEVEDRQTLLLNPDLIKTGSDSEATPDLSKTLPLDAPFQPTQPLRREGGVGLSAGVPLDRTQPLAKESVAESAAVTPVQKLKKVSSVVIDQAAYDPSIRFLLVAAILFILSLFLLIMSKVLS
jgi:predicted RNA-binding Zn-ribbon protein involved in translation (DUF1610 family)